MLKAPLLRRRRVSEADRWFDIVSKCAYYAEVTTIYYKGNCTIMPRHPPKEVKKDTVQSIVKALGIKEL
jgi:hypothetical protein